MSVVRSLAWTLVAGLLGLSACARQSLTTIGPATTAGQRKMIADKRVITDASLSRHLQIVGLNEAAEPGGPLKVQMEVVNVTRSPRLFSYRFEWFDANGMLLNLPQSTFVPRQIEGGESLFVSAVAPSAEVKDFRVKLMESVR